MTDEGSIEDAGHPISNEEFHNRYLRDEHAIEMTFTFRPNFLTPAQMAEVEERLSTMVDTGKQGPAARMVEMILQDWKYPVQVTEVKRVALVKRDQFHA